MAGTFAIHSRIVNMNRIRVIPIGSGSSGNAMYIEMSDKGFLVDMGVRYKYLKETLAANGVDLATIPSIFITHSHYDHIIGFKVTIKHIEGKVYASKRTRDMLASSRVQGLEYDQYYDIDGIRVLMFGTSHDCPGSAGFIFEYQGLKLGYATDLGHLSEEILTYLKSSDLVVIESNHNVEMLKSGPYPYDLKRRILSEHGHLSNDDCAIACRRLYDSGTRNFILAHLSQENNEESIALSTFRKAVPYDDVNVQALHVKGLEFMEYEIGGSHV